ncbi:uncharacterized protein LOC111601773 isoform X1 [Drosophila hydei]|uniref:Uncharacterized protein LOC111601773 isoform X1 n=2 Tax=Drosophila hydei TaxID=7224 RepID=A0A6J1M303_DROHY|nr:uncharacterized protein LOC111601773 isoform X1 [Drosophila hydei]XP_023174285.2 uncharacterized protein LOC111601773 isoform X1 [Drosophila hydei]XP_030081551.1 uncharacterized protein LOC111601773 isoform X1 [Drosophila hydei]
MQPNWILGLSLIVLAILGCSRAASVALQLQSPTNVLNDTQIEVRPLTWLRSAQDMFASPAGHVIVQVAKELLHRSAGNSQVLSLNLTNLLIIVLLKVLIFSAGLLGAGHWSGMGYGHGYARSAAHIDGSYGLGLSSGDDYLIMGFLAAQGAGQDDCLYAAACACPNAAYEYAKAGRALLGAIEVFESAPLEKPRYNDLIVLMERAAYDGFRGASCNTTQSCDGLL